MEIYTGLACSLSSCDKPVKARSLCAAHYWRWGKYGDPMEEVPLRRSPGSKPKECSVETCTKDMWSRGWCGTHYARWRKSGDVCAEEPIGGDFPVRCKLEGCDKPHASKGFCSLHYSRWKSGVDPYIPVNFKERNIGDVHIDSSGYAREKVAKESLYYAMGGGSHKGWIPQHRLVMARKLGRCLESYEQVHHIDGNKQNNDIDNLQLRTLNHGSGIVQVCVDCGSDNVKPARIGRSL